MEQKLIKRKILKLILEYTNQDNIIVLLGARQVGKTSLLYLLQKELIKQKINPKNIIYLDIENPKKAETIDSLDLDKVNKLMLDLGADSEKTAYLIIDEIQYLKNPSAFLKHTFDHFKKIKLIVSGSSSLEIKKKFSDRLTGRKKIFEIQPLNFAEFLKFKKQPIKKRINLKKILASKTIELPQKITQEKLEQLFEEYAVWGGHPKTALLQEKNHKISSLEEIYTSYVRKDIKDLISIENPSTFNKIVELLALQIGQMTNLDNLSQKAKIDLRTLEKYLFLLENTFVIKIIRPYFTNKQKEIVKMPKIYFSDLGIRNMIVENFTNLEKRPDKGAVIENAVLTEIFKQKSNLDQIYFWRTKSKIEVDFIWKRKLNLIPIEVKYQPFTKPKIPSGLRSFIKKYKPEKAVVITKNFFSQETLNKTKIFWIPAWAV